MTQTTKGIKPNCLNLRYDEVMANSKHLTILYGENQPASRQRLVELIEQSKNSGYQVHHLEAKQLTQAELEQVLGRNSLFDAQQVVVIESLHSLPNSKNKNQLIKLVAGEANSGQTHLILWEKRDLTATMLKQFPTAQVEFFKLSRAMFRWLDQVGQPVKTVIPLMHQAIDQDGAELTFLMLVRQIRLLIETKSGDQPAGPPFMVSKLKQQANYLTLDELFNLHLKLLTIDHQQKTSGSNLSLPQALDLLWVLK